MTTEALAQFLHDLGAALVRLAEGLDDRPRATVCHLPTPTASWPETPVHECPDCGLMFGTPSGLGAHRRSVHARTPIPPRPVDVALPGAIGEADDDAPSATPPPTVAEGAPSPSDDDASVPCPDCGRELRSAKALTVHRARAHGVAGAWRDGRPRRPSSERVPLTCSICGHVAKGHQGAAAHARSHAGTITSTPTPCPKGCGRVLGSAQGAAVHGKRCAGPVEEPEGINEDLATLGLITENTEAVEAAGVACIDPDEPDDTPAHGSVTSAAKSSHEKSHPTSEELDPLDPGRVIWQCMDCDHVSHAKIDANAHARRTGHRPANRYTTPTRSRA